jgi:hypothetical protein
MSSPAVCEHKCLVLKLSSRRLTPTTTGMMADERVSIEYFHVPPGQVAACLTSDKSEQYLHDSARRHAALFGEGAQYLGEKGCSECRLR